MAVNSIKFLFRKHPLISNSVVYGSFYVGAEFSQQILSQKLTKDVKDIEINYESLGRYFVVGSLINSNYFYVWYKWLDSRFVGTSKQIIVKKLLLDQFVMTPPLYVIFYVSMSLMEGKKDLLEECKEKFVKTFTMSCMFWIPAQAMNFLYLPNSARVIYMGACSFAWVNVLCWIKRKNVELRE